MARKIEEATDAEWRQIGEQTKLVRREIFKLLELACPFVPVKVSDRLISRVVRHLDRFRAEAENEMFRRGGPEDCGVFYGDC